MLPLQDICITCNNPSTLQCSRCKMATYCSKACQTLHWNQHKERCSLFRSVELLRSYLNIAPIAQKQLIIVQNNGKDTIVARKHKLCVTCGEITQLRCGGCKSSAYCSKDCEAKEWTMHKQVCSKEVRNRSIMYIDTTVADFTQAYRALVYIMEMGMKIKESKPYNAFLVLRRGNYDMKETQSYQISGFHVPEVLETNRIAIIQLFDESYCTKLYFEMKKDELEATMIGNETGVEDLDLITFFRTCQSTCAYYSVLSRYQQIQKCLFAIVNITTLLISLSTTNL